MVAAGAAALVATNCDTTGPVPDDPIVWSIPRFVNTSRAVVTDTSVIVGARDAGSLLSLDRQTGAILWERRLDEFGAFFGRVVVQKGDLVYAAPFDLYAVEAATGIVRWTYRAGGGTHMSRYPAVAEGSLFVATSFGEVLRLEPNTGTVEWRGDLGEAVFPAAVAEGLVLVGTRSFADTVTRAGPLGAGRVVALSSADGTLVWETAVPDSAGFPLSGGVIAPPLVVDDVVVVGTRSSRVLGLRLSDGAKLWEHAEGSPIRSDYRNPAARFGDLAVLLRNDGLLEAFEPASGRRLWTVGQGAGAAGSAPEAVSERLYAMFHVNLWIIRPDGTVEWRYGKLRDGDGLPVFLTGLTVAPDGIIYASWVDEARDNAGFFGAIRPPSLMN